MKIFRMFGRGIRDAFKSVKRNLSLSVASISCISITLLVVSLAILVSFNVKNFSKTVKSDVTMIIFLDLDVTTEELNNFENNLKKLDNIESIEFKSSDSQKESLIAEDNFWEEVFATLNEDDEIFHNSYMIKVKDIDSIGKTADEIKAMDKVQLVNYGQEMIDPMITLFNLIEKVTIVIVIVLIIVTVFLIVNTIKLTIFSRKREISIMRVVGASNISIKIPFVIEGMVIGIIGSIVPIAITIYGYVAFYDIFKGQLFYSFIQLVDPNPLVYFISITILIIGMIVGMLGSSRAVRKYLKV